MGRVRGHWAGRGCERGNVWGSFEGLPIFPLRSARIRAMRRDATRCTAPHVAMSSNRQGIHDSERTMRIGTPHTEGMAEVSRGLKRSDTPGTTLGRVPERGSTRFFWHPCRGAGLLCPRTGGYRCRSTPGKKQSVGLPESAGDLDRVGEFRDLQQIQGCQQMGCWFWPSAYLSSGMSGGGGDGVDDPRDTATWFRSNLARPFKKRAFPARHYVRITRRFARMAR